MSDVIKAFGILLYRIIDSKKNGKLHEDLSKVEFLFLKASYADKHWSPPKGLMNTNETGLQTAERETLEETGLNREKYKLESFQRTIKYNVKGRPKETTYFLARMLNNSEAITLSDEHTEHQWIKRTDSASYLLPETLETLLTDAEEYIKKEEHIYA